MHTPSARRKCGPYCPSFEAWPCDDVLYSDDELHVQHGAAVMEGLNALRASSRRPYCQACNVAFLGTAHHAICPQAAMNELESGRKPSAHASSIMLRLAYRLHQGCMQHAQVREYNPMPKLTKLNESNMHTLPAHPPQQPISEFSGRQVGSRDRDPSPRGEVEKL